MAICLLWPARGVPFLRNKLLPQTLTKIRELSGLIFETFVTTPPSSPRGSALVSGRLRLATSSTQHLTPSSLVATAVELEEEEEGGPEGALSEHHHVPPHEMAGSSAVQSGTVVSTMPVIKGTRPKLDYSRSTLG